MVRLTAKRIVHAIREIVIQNQVKNIFASSLMTPSPLVIESGDSISTARSIMRKKKIDHLPVVKGNKLSGIITSSDILRIMLPDMKQGKKSYALDNIQSRFDIKVSGIMVGSQKTRRGAGLPRFGNRSLRGVRQIQTFRDFRADGVVLIRRDGDRGQDTDDGNHDHQFDEGEALLHFVKHYYSWK